MIQGQGKDVIDKLKLNPFLDGPTQTLVKAVVKIISTVPEFKLIFSDSIDPYERIDYSMRQLPALRVYNYEYRKEHESHYITGELLMDIVWPATLRRDELQYFQDVLSSAILQQFRRPNYFETAQALIPGINELGKVFSVNKELGLKLEDGAVPLTQMRPNFRIDLKVWDAYLEEQGRTKDDPFKVTLAELLSVYTRIMPQNDDGTADTAAEVDLQVKAGG